MSATVRLPRRPEGTRLERLTSAATAFVALQRVAQQQRMALPDAHATIDGHDVTVTAADLERDLDACEAAVIATRRLLGWRR